MRDSIAAQILNNVRVVASKDSIMRRGLNLKTRIIKIT